MTDHHIRSAIKDIRTRLRLSMNGVVSASMREKGAVYALNFGVSMPELKKIAVNYPQDPDLAEALWREDVRELKILAAMLQPASSFSKEQAWRWASALTHPDLIEFCSTILFQHLPYAGELAAEWVAHPGELMQLQGFHLFARICRHGQLLSPQEAGTLIREARKVMDNDDLWRTQQAVRLAFKYYGRQSDAHATAILSALSDYANSGSPAKQELYEELKYEADSEEKKWNEMRLP